MVSGKVGVVDASGEGGVGGDEACQRRRRFVVVILSYLCVPFD